MSEQFLATASVRIIPDTTGFAAALAAEVTAATRAVRIPAVASALAANTVATRTFTAATGVSTVAVAESTATVTAHGAALARDTIEERANAAAALRTARAHETATRGFGAEILAALGLRGATLAASAPFLAGAAAAVVAVKSVEEYTKEAEAAARVNAILGDELGKASEEWARQAVNIGLSVEAALKYEGAIAQVFKNVRIANEENAKFSQDLVTRAADVAARANVPVTQVLRAFQLALSGNLRGLRQFVPAVDAATIAQRAMADTGKTVKAELTTQELVLARYEVIMARSANQAGTFAERSKNLAAQSKILKSNLADVAAEVGGPLAHSLTGWAIALNAVFSGMSKLKNILGATAPFFSLLFGPVKQTTDELGLVPGVAGPAGAALAEVGQSAAGAAGGVSNLGAGLQNLTGPLDAARAAALALQSALAGLGGANTALLRAQAEGAPLSTQLALAQERLAKAAAAVAAADVTAPKKGKATTQKALLQEELSARQQVASIQAQIDALDKKGAASAKKAGKTRQELLDEQDQALLDAQQYAQGQLTIAAEKARGTKSLVDDVKVLQAELVLTNKQIVEATRIHDAQTRLNTIQQLQLQAVTLQNQIDDQIEAQRQKRRQARVDALDAAVNLASLDAQIAHARGLPNAEIAALIKENSALERKRKAWQGNTQRQKEITLAIAQNNQQIKELRKAQKENAGLSSEAQFQFLTTEAGFVANLLGNLIPRGATAGLVGGTAGAISTPTIPHPAAALSASAQTAGGPRAVSSGQMATLIHVQMQMLQAILRLTGQRAHPENTYQRYSAADDLNVATST